ncbi:dihydrolipoyl dehydrogenase [Metabacillus sediminilitoris]|uniref:Dihydrolipoyl dehydrogenase n=1 Tax=Metabacillus sediminilitoris TaxID=2567941 RepID=A0A4S4BNP9_9BACI|nr:dihydrolipoyl dehydrogenase [Metabacillus sediminilitoris]QGQ45137.1 dihydrolipoyl dehydrogenase [Metabacillus sediminilitoris]THF76503.1 dihydrolipoyl dehydrogenase [Metabacillus sediminilitoris]
MTSYDVVIVGGGPGGYVAALRAAKNGKKTALVEAADLGGTCLNRGCIPSKTLLKHAEIIEGIQKAKNWGIKTEGLSFSLTEMLARKDQVIATLQSGIEHLLNAGKIDVYKGYGTIHDDKKVTIQQENDSQQISGEKIIIATGSQPVVPPIDGIENVSYHTTDTIFSITEIPKSIVIVGGGVIGVEFANIFASLNTEVTIVELGGRIIPTEDEDASKELLKSLKKKGIKVLTKHQVISINENDSGKIVNVTSEKGKFESLTSAEILLAVGRKPNLSAVSDLNLKLSGRHIAVNNYLETSKKDYFAVGDVIGGLQLAHVASAEGLTAVENLDGKKEKMNYKVMPRCIYTNPQVASVGMSEAELKDKGIKYKVNKYSFSGNGKALAAGETEGFSKVMVDEKYGEIVGVVMVGAHVTEMISQSSAYMYLEGTVDELAQMVQPHPSLSEVLMESANSLIEKGIHS